MKYKNLTYNYCRENCVFFDKCKANISQCVIFRIEQILSEFILNEFELEIFKLNFGLTDGIHYSISEIAKKYNISEFKVKRSIGSVLRRLRHPTRRQKYLSLIETIMSTDEITPYSLMIKSIYQYRGTNAEFWEEFKGEIAEDIKLLESNVLDNVKGCSVVCEWVYDNESGNRIIKKENLEDAKKEVKELAMHEVFRIQKLGLEIVVDHSNWFEAVNSKGEYVKIRIKIERNKTKSERQIEKQNAMGVSDVKE